MYSFPTANVVLVSPEIPQNTGNIIRLCANTGSRLHLVKPLGFNLDHPGLRRASLDYKDISDILVHDSLDELSEYVNICEAYGATSSSNNSYIMPKYELGSTVIFGSESMGLPCGLLSKLKCERRVRIPMLPNNRSLNISNAVAIIVYEIWRQNNFEGKSEISPSGNPYFS